MLRKKAQFNITVAPTTAAALSSLAKQEHTSVSNIAEELIMEALEYRNDTVSSTFAEAQDIENSRNIK